MGPHPITGYSWVVILRSVLRPLVATKLIAVSLPTPRAAADRGRDDNLGAVPGRRLASCGSRARSRVSLERS
eukprot:7264640-Prymnesium_polylepis.1